MMHSWNESLNHALQEKREQQRLRQRGGPAMAIDAIDFGSNDYLGLRKSPEIHAALADAPVDSGFGSGASPVLPGYTPAHQRLESQLAKLSGSESALVFSSGYACNVGSISCLAGANDLVLSDALNHASLIDGCRLSRASKYIYPHNDIAALKEYLRQHRSHYDRGLIVTESVFSMDGDEAPLVDIVELAKEFDCGVVVDEAHATGVFGERGGGLLESLGLQSQVLLKLGTLSKALGSIGGFACGAHEIIEYLVNHCRSYLFSTAPPIPVMRASSVAVELAVQMAAERIQLQSTARRLRSRLRDLGLDVSEGTSPIVPVIIGSESETLRAHDQLLAAGVYVPAIRPPTVPEGTCRLRISLSAAHSADDLALLVDSLAHNRPVN